MGSMNTNSSIRLPSLGTATGSAAVNGGGGGGGGGDGKQIHSSPELLILPQVALSDKNKNAKNSRKIGWE